MTVTTIFVFLVGMSAASLVFIAAIAIAEHRSPKFPDMPCIPDGACRQGLRCAMHDSAFQWVAKGPRPR